MLTENEETNIQPPADQAAEENSVIQNEQQSANNRNFFQNNKWKINKSNKINQDLKLSLNKLSSLNYHDIKEEIFNICVNYYSKNGYYARLINKVQSTEGYIPTFGEYKKLTENKYARGILRGWYGNAKYEPGALVVASSAGSWSARNIKLGLILRSNATLPVSYGKGNKIYHVLDIPTNKKYFLEERHLKHAKSQKKKKKKTK